MLFLNHNELTPKREKRRNPGQLAWESPGGEGLWAKQVRKKPA